MCFNTFQSARSCFNLFTNPTREPRLNLSSFGTGTPDRLNPGHRALRASADVPGFARWFRQSKKTKLPLQRLLPAVAPTAEPWFRDHGIPGSRGRVCGRQQSNWCRASRENSSTKGLDPAASPLTASSGAPGTGGCRSGPPSQSECGRGRRLREENV
jgi:hypothetical protein